ncbi:MAG: GNAT family N-acetyltransferase [Chitinophagaceae bacterium]|nr:GNAT family N-acetyltransferase [Chitinophagaceae bacterium]MBK8951963.1 GNAT family N-acetyltransferase [Chitinophagaceae bacterium]
MPLLDIFEQNPILENNRVLLRPLQETDFEHLLPFSLNEPELWYYGLDTAAGEENLKNYIARAIKKRETKQEYPFTIFDKKENTYAGSTRFYDICQEYSTTEIGYTFIGKNFQHTGVNRHCKLLMLTYVFDVWGLERCGLRADARNVKSIKAMKAIGCVQEGIQRSHMPALTGGRRDSIVMSILKKEWFRGKKELLEGITR